MGRKNIVLLLGLVMVCVGTLMIFFNGQKNAQISDAEIKKRAEELGMVEQNPNAILTSELENMGKDTQSVKDTENTEGIEDIEGTEDSKDTEIENTKDIEDTKEEKDNNDSKNKEPEKEEENKTSKKKKTKKKSVKKKKTGKNTEEKKQENVNVNTKTITINSGMTAGEICRKLEEEGLVKDAEDFREYLVDKNIQRKLQAGTFEIANGADYDEIAGALYKG